MHYAREPVHRHGVLSRTGILLVNLGTPAAPTAPAVRRYLAQFLSDSRVVEIPRALWLPLLHGVILRTRPSKSAAKYASIWTPEGSPLAVWTDKQAALLQGYLGGRGIRGVVKAAMRYGEPSIPSQLQALKDAGCTRILVLPLYPQYAGSTTASAFDAITEWARQVRHVPEFRFVHRYHDDDGYIGALADRIRSFWQREGRADHLVMSFHGVPERTLKLGDPYFCECHKTARLLAQQLGLQADQYTISFQSRFGKARWVEPSTDATLRKLAKQGVKHLQVCCPGFPADCLETLEEIAIEGRALFMTAGGQRYDYIPCLNDQVSWIRALVSLVERHTAGWPMKAEHQPHAGALDEQRRRALALGAKS